MSADTADSMTAIEAVDLDPLPMVSVCVCPARSPQRLERLLASLALQTYPPERLEVVVIENDTGNSGLALINAERLHPKISVRHGAERVASAAQTRNAAVAASVGLWLAFIGDEYEPSACWLEALVRTAVETRSAVVLGPKIATYPPDTAAWIRRSMFFEKRRFETAKAVSSDYGRTSNALVSGEWLRKRPLSPFDPACGRNDLEGHDFFLWVERNGGAIVWCDDAVVSTVVPQSRHNLTYMLKRSLSSSTAYWRGINQYRSVLLAWREAATGVVGAIVLAAVGAAMLTRGVHVAVPYWVRMAKGLGRAAALTGFKNGDR